MIISLTGFMGCGKSSVGRELSELLCCPFIDLDSRIEEAAGRSIPEFFKSEGEVAFRSLELEILKQTIKSKHSPASVLALGGGAVMTPECAELVKNETCCIYLRASIDTLLDHLSAEADGRPMLSSDSSDLRSRICELMSQRSDTYTNTAHIIIDTDGKSIETIAAEIISRLG